jgi:threonine/homoserine/homoserine lactone efflux protein
MDGGLGHGAELAKLTLFLAAYIAYVMTPGPRSLSVSSCAMLNGLDHAFMMVLGLVAGTAVLGVLSLNAAGPIAATLPAWIIHTIAIGVLLWLAKRIAFPRHAAAGSGRICSRRSEPLLGGCLVSLFNPALAAFLLSSLSGPLLSIVKTEGSAVIVPSIAVIDTLWFSAIAYGFSRGRVREVALRKQKEIRIVSALVLTGLALVKVPAALAG